MSLCRFCDQEFKNQQAVRAHLRGCAAYRDRAASWERGDLPKAIAEPKASDLPKAEEPTVTDGVASGDHRPAGRRVGSSGALSRPLSDELSSLRMEIEIEKTLEARKRWEERRSREEREKASLEREVQLEAMRLKETGRQKAEMEKKIQSQIQEAKAEACRILERRLPPHVLGEVYKGIERELASVGVLARPLSELKVLAEGARDRVLKLYPSEFQRALDNSKEELRGEMKKFSLDFARQVVLPEIERRLAELEDLFQSGEGTPRERATMAELIRELRQLSTDCLHPPAWLNAPF